jgi:hypothetical protein
MVGKNEKQTRILKDLCRIAWIQGTPQEFKSHSNNMIITNESRRTNASKCIRIRKKIINVDNKNAWIYNVYIYDISVI